MAEVVNLNRARKARTRAAGKAAAEENRARFGRTKAERKLAEAEQAREARLHQAHEREEER